MLPKLKGCGQVSKLSLSIDLIIDDGVIPESLKSIYAGEFTGSISGLPDDVYHSLPYVSSSQLKYLYKTSPKHFKAKFIDKILGSDDPSYAMKLGTAAHSMILTPDLFEKSIYIAKKIDARTKDGKEAKAKMDLDSAGKTIIYEADSSSIVGMKDSVFSNNTAVSFLDGSIKELSLFWKCPGSGLMMKARIDALSVNNLVELKTTKSAQPKMFGITAFNLNYDLSAAHYLEGVRNVLGFKPPVYFIVVENEAPYVSQVYQATDDFLELGFAKWLESTEVLSACRSKNEWPGYASASNDEILFLSSPAWMNKKENTNSDEDEGF
ncbi:MAG: PD-(D/E)XK nuclease-like domain-containing protein [Phycisphaerae bacterium]